MYFFNTTLDGTNWAPRFAIYGDLGVGNAQSLSTLQKEIQEGRYDAVLHIGKTKAQHNAILCTDNGRPGGRGEGDGMMSSYSLDWGGDICHFTHG